jgi:hypothetical protein
MTVEKAAAGGNAQAARQEACNPSFFGEDRGIVAPPQESAGALIAHPRL